LLDVRWIKYVKWYIVWLSRRASPTACALHWYFFDCYVSINCFLSHV